MSDTNPIIELFTLTKDELKGFVIQLIATLIGTGVGFGFVMWWDRRKKKLKIKEDTEHLIDSVLEELIDIQKGMKEAPEHNIVKWTDKGFEGEFGSIAIPVYDSAINSGSFGLLKPSLKTSVANIYDRINLVRFWTEQIKLFYSTPIYSNNNTDVVKREADKLLYNLERRSKEVLNMIDKIISQLKSAKSQLE